MAHKRTTETNPWDFLKEYHGKVFSGTWPTLPELFGISVNRFPDRPCFTVYEPERVSLTYREAHARILAVAQHLRSLGVERGDRVAVSGKNSPEWAIAYLATLFAGAVVVPIDYQLHDGEIANLIHAGGARVLFIDEERFEVFAGGGPGDTRHPVKLDAVVSLSRAHKPYIYELRTETSYPVVPAGESDTAAILFTSGTTGRPKGVVLTHQNLVADCFLAQANLTILHTDVFYALLPIHHSYCMLAVFIESFSVGAETVFGKRVVVKQILSDLKAAQVTMFLGVPMLFNKLLAGIMRGIREKGPVVYGIIRTLMAISGATKKVTGKNPGKKLFHSVLDKASLASIRICISGGGPLAPSIFRQYNQLGIDFVQGYGLTETSPILTLNPVEHYKETSVGKVIPQADLRILDPDERGVGEIIVKGPMVMQGYYRMPEETAEVFTEDGFFRTGDLGYLDAENYLYLTGRARNLIVGEGGKNVFPEEIENEFQLYDEIAQILVRGYHAETGHGGELIEALVYPNKELFASGGAAAPGDGTAATPEEIEARIKAIVAEVNHRLQPYQRINRTILVDEEMEMTSTKKIKRGTVK
ncbi:MAG: long-chain fatty acid--CoA ligase [Spirochaetaceae bacterium]|nr:MAG: long-chain fatty acid--CoA ligase [Spirochaetaceae bacterium]